MRCKPPESVLHRTSQQRIESVRVKAKPCGCCAALTQHRALEREEPAAKSVSAKSASDDYKSDSTRRRKYAGEVLKTLLKLTSKHPLECPHACSRTTHTSPRACARESALTRTYSQLAKLRRLQNRV
jgi:hypothetical protein